MSKCNCSRCTRKRETRKRQFRNNRRRGTRRITNTRGNIEQAKLPDRIKIDTTQGPVIAESTSIRAIYVITSPINVMVLPGTDWCTLVCSVVDGVMSHPIESHIEIARELGMSIYSWKGICRGPCEVCIKKLVLKKDRSYIRSYAYKGGNISETKERSDTGKMIN